MQVFFFQNLPQAPSSAVFLFPTVAGPSCHPAPFPAPEALLQTVQAHLASIRPLGTCQPPPPLPRAVSGLCSLLPCFLSEVATPGSPGLISLSSWSTHTGSRPPWHMHPCLAPTLFVFFPDLLACLLQPLPVCTPSVGDSGYLEAAEGIVMMGTCS